MRRSLRLRAASAVSSTHSTEGGRTICRFHIRSVTKRRGGILPARLRFSVHRGVTLVELMIGFLILTIICISWFTIAQIQSAKKEALRREAVERLAGMMDAFTDYSIFSDAIANANDLIGCSWWFDEERIQFKERDLNLVSKMFESEPVWDSGQRRWKFETISPIGYRLFVTRLEDYISQLGTHRPDDYMNWSEKDTILVGELYDQNGDIRDGDVGYPFCSFKVFLGIQW